MIVHPDRKTIEIPISQLADIKLALDSIQATALSESVGADDARSIVSDLNAARDALALPRDAVRHEKWAVIGG